MGSQLQSEWLPCSDACATPRACILLKSGSPELRQTDIQCIDTGVMALSSFHTPLIMQPKLAWLRIWKRQLRTRARCQPLFASASGNLRVLVARRSHQSLVGYLSV